MNCVKATVYESVQSYLDRGKEIKYLDSYEVVEVKYVRPNHYLLEQIGVNYECR